jgi:hypothetical protein
LLYEQTIIQVIAAAFSTVFGAQPVELLARDTPASIVGAWTATTVLTFDFVLKDGVWSYEGSSSKDPIHEVWTRREKTRY